jgi:hypothetical protein
MNSTQEKYHYQSYLFSLRKDSISIFINKVKSPITPINTAYDVILNYEVNITTWFSTINSFLKIGQFGLNKGQHIFFTNDKLYIYLKKINILPFTKIKHIT